MSATAYRVTNGPGELLCPACTHEFIAGTASDGFWFEGISDDPNVLWRMTLDQLLQLWLDSADLDALPVPAPVTAAELGPGPRYCEHAEGCVVRLC